MNRSLAFANALQLLVVATEKSSDAFQLRPRGAIDPSIYLPYIYLSIRLSIKCDRCDRIAVHIVLCIWYDVRWCDSRSSFAAPYSQLGSPLARSSSILTRQTQNATKLVANVEKAFTQRPSRLLCANVCNSGVAPRKGAPSQWVGSGRQGRQLRQWDMGAGGVRQHNHQA